MHADKIYKELVEDILANGEERENRTGVGTLSVFGRQCRYDLNEGFPILTTKKVHFKSVVGELLWFLRGDTNVKWLNDNGITIWDEWKDENGDLGPVYGFSWRRWETSGDTIVPVPVRQPDFTPWPIVHIALQEPIPNKNDKLIGQLVRANNGQLYKVLEKVSMPGKNARYKVQFQDNGFIAFANRPNLLNGQVQNYLDRTVAGTGYLGEAKIKSSSALYNLWANMIARCYNKQHPNYAAYGGRGVTVAEQWHSFAQFCKTIQQVPFYHAWRDDCFNYCLDKDYFGSNQYGPSTTIFLDRATNRDLANAGDPFLFDGELFISQKECAQKYGLDRRRISEVLSGKRTPAGKYARIEKAIVPAGILYRKRRVIDQIKEVIESIKTNPNSRRLIVSAWNVPMLQNMALPPCHTMFQFYVSKGKLSCQLYQRSCDLGLGQPFNVASYALLTHMIAQVCDLGVGEFVHTFGDVHVYKNHVDKLKQQLERNPFPAPKLWLNPEIKDIDSFTFDDIKLENYQHHPGIKMEVAV